MSQTLKNVDKVSEGKVFLDGKYLMLFLEICLLLSAITMLHHKYQFNSNFSKRS